MLLSLRAFAAAFVSLLPATAALSAPLNVGFILAEDGGGFQGDLLAHYWTNRRKLEHRTLVTLDINDYYRWDPSLNYAGPTNPDLIAWNAVRTVTLDRNTLAPVGAIPYFLKPLDPTIGVKTRHQKVDFLKPNAGFNYKVTPAVRVYASYSQSYFVSQNDNAQAHFNPTFKSEVADGWDYGFKGELLNGRLNYTISGFYANRHNVSVTEIEEQPPGSGNYVFDREYLRVNRLIGEERAIYLTYTINRAGKK